MLFNIRCSNHTNYGRPTHLEACIVGGRYVLMVSLYNRLGGSVMKWSRLKGQQWGGATLPIIHNGNFYNIEMAVRATLYISQT